jgi:4'-phosphopantetheinyl transferase
MAPAEAQWVAACAPVSPAPASNQEMEILVARLDAESDIRELLDLLDDGERARASRFVFERDRRRFAVGRARLRQLLASRLDIAPAEVELVHGAHGKPALSRRFADSGLRFNVSHSGDVVVYAFSRDREIGVDVEAVRALRDGDALAARVFSPREYEAYRALAPVDRPLGFFNGWTRKEAFIKALGEGLSLALDCFDVSLAPGEEATLLRVDRTHGDACGWQLYSFVPLSGYVGAVVLERPKPQSGPAPPITPAR